jgi:hypothetical protein
MPSIGAMPSGGSGGSIGQTFAALFGFAVDWRYILALLLMLLSVTVVESVWPEWVWPYVGVLLLGIVVVNERFGPALDSLVGGN